MTERQKTWLADFIIVLAFSIIFTMMWRGKEGHEVPIPSPIIEDSVLVDTVEIVFYPELSDKGKFILGIAWNESRFHTDIKNREGSSATGFLQLLKVYVDECNRLLGEEVYTYEDRYNPQKCLEMFDIIQDKYNPKGNYVDMINIHATGNVLNPNSIRPYINKVFQNVEIIERYEVLRRHIIEYDKG